MSSGKTGNCLWTPNRVRGLRAGNLPNAAVGRCFGQSYYGRGHPQKTAVSFAAVTPSEAQPLPVTNTPGRGLHKLYQEGTSEARRPAAHRTYIFNDTL